MPFYGVKLHRSDILRLPDHDDACTEETFHAWCEKRRRAGQPLAVDLFAGAGGLSLGIEQAGWTVAASVDHDVRAQETHRANFPGLPLHCDLADPEERTRIVTMLQQTTVDLIAGGPPCQPFSRAGRSKIRSLVKAGVRDEFDQRKELWQAFLEIVLRVHPRAVLMENVSDMALGDDFRVVRKIVDALENDDYHTDVQLVDAWAHGVPQHRKRLIVLARLDSDTFSWPQPTLKVTLRDAIGDLPELPELDPVGDRRLPYTPPADPSSFLREMRRNVEDTDGVWDHMTRPVRPDDLVTFKQMTSRTLYSQLDKKLRRYKAETFDDKYKRLDWADLSRSITAHIAKDGYWYIHPEQHRTLTVREAARIQTFPDHFRFSGTRSDAFRQIGNAVPPRLGQAAASALWPAQGGRAGGRICPSRWRGLHQQLANWARERRDGHLWFSFPGPDVKEAIAVIGALVGAERLEADRRADALVPLKGRRKLLAVELDRFCDAVEDARIEQKLERVRPLTRLRKVWTDEFELATTLELKPAEQARFLLLLDRDVMPASQGALRVAARVAGTKPDKPNRLTDGRVELARLVGGGGDAPLRMAALSLLGRTTCTPKEPVCGTCPLARWCDFAVERPGTTTMF